jgi:hypothetical protein
MDDVIFQASDLAKERTRLLAAARSGRAVVRDKDGTGLVMLPESRLAVLEGYARWSLVHQRLGSLLASKREFSVAEWGELSWLRVFERADIEAFADELHESLIASLADGDLKAINETVAAWLLTSRQLDDPLRRSVLLGHDDPLDLVEAEEPIE